MAKMNTKKRIAAYAASLDPITNGHLDIVRRMAPLYDTFIVIVASDTRKNYTFTAKERVEMASAAVSDILNVRVESCVGEYVARFALRLGADTLIRGIRNFKDVEDEQVLACENREIAPGIETLWVPCRPELAHVSSSMVKGHVGIDPNWTTEAARSVPREVLLHLKEKHLVGQARKHWLKLTKFLQTKSFATAKEETDETIFEKLVETYLDRRRAYHNLEHIVTMLDLLEAHFGRNEFWPEIALAIWFHDYVYDPRASDNEERSVEASRHYVSFLTCSRGRPGVVERLILATKHNKMPQNREEAIIIDLDLAILGAPEKAFNEYCGGIMSEYEHVPPRKFVEGRIRVLTYFLKREPLYYTAKMRSLLDTQARKNLRRAISELSR
ncbi:MAG TPA: pantetheine-phosphate adenylyltransferase [Candidatus Paceibacterota bacterium]|nr:pantetheine-phosphate adenylyltransferase [Candidatus Paceibacterota bacterium]